MKTSILYEELSPLELKQVLDDNGIIYLPLGSLEWHSKHLPFGLDALLSYELCKQACQITGGCVIPPLYFGTDREHKVNGKIYHGMDAKAGEILPGSIYFIKKNIFLNLLKQIVKNVKEQGFKKLVLVSAHSGAAQQKTLEKLFQETFGKLKLYIFPGKLFEGSIDHAGYIETSFMLALDKSLVHIERFKEPMGPIVTDNIQSASAKEGQIRINKIVKQIVRDVLK